MNSVVILHKPLYQKDRMKFFVGVFVLVAAMLISLAFAHDSAQQPSQPNMQQQPLVPGQQPPQFGLGSSNGMPQMGVNGQPMPQPLPQQSGRKKREMAASGGISSSTTTTAAPSR